MAIDIKELAKDKQIEMSDAETKKVVNNYMKENRTLNTVIENLKKEHQDIVIKKLYDVDDGWLYSAEIEMFPGLIIYEDTVQDAYDELMLAKIDWLNALLEDSWNIIMAQALA